MTRLMLIVLVLLVGTAFDAAAQQRGKKGPQKIYKCQNEKGEIYFSQTYDPAKCGGGGAQLNAQGVAVKSIDRIKTPEEIAAEKAQAEKEAEAKRIADAQAHQDQVLMQSYASEDELVRVHQDELKVLDTEIATTRMSMKNQEKSLAELLASAAEAERANKPVPEPVAKNIAMVRKQIETQTAFIARKEAEKKAATDGFQARLQRFRELKAAQQKQLSGQ
jgi:hypothetical protein